MRSYPNFGPDRFSRFDVYWIQTENNQSINIDLFQDSKRRRAREQPSYQILCEHIHIYVH